MVDDRVLILTPTGADAEVAAGLLREAGVASLACPGVDELCDRLDEGAGALLVAEEALSVQDPAGLVSYLAGQPAWSDIPLIVLTTAEGGGRSDGELVERFGAVGNMTLLERPFRVETLVSTVRAALRARRKQYEVRSLVSGLRSSEERFRQLADAMPQIVWVTRPDGYHEYFNRRWFDYIGVDFEHSEGHQWADPLHPEDRERARARWAHSLATGEPYEIEYRFRRRDGAYRWFLARALPVRDAAGRVERWFGTCTDVDDQRRDAEERQRLASVIANSRDFIGIADLDGRVTFVNDAGRTMVGLGSLAEARGTRVADYFPPADRPRVLDEILPRVVREGHWAGEMHFRHFQTGQAIPVLWDVFRIDDAATGRPISLATVTRDITQLKRIEAEREALLASERAARTAAENAGRVKDEFLATLSHELRTPLNAIVGWSQILRNSSDGADVAEGVEVIARNARAQQQIIEDLLDMSRIMSGKVRLDVQRVDLRAVVEAAVDTVRHAADAKGVRVQSVLDPKAGPVAGDPNRLQQVFWNLLTNAVKFTPRDGRVQVLLERVNSHLEVAVSDTGEGIRPEFLPHVFDRFRQADASTTRRHGGLGLGLAIVKQLVELHGGTIRVKSPGEGMGSTFTVALPLTAVHPGPEPQAEQEEHERRHPSARPDLALGEDTCLKLRGVRVLVVDDEPDARGLVRRLLEDCEAVVTTASSAAEALGVLVRERPDVLVSDIGMPGEDGYSLIRRVRALGPDAGGRTPALALTAYARSEDRTRAVVAGYQMHVAKPVEPSELIAMVASLAGRAATE